MRQINALLGLTLSGSLLSPVLAQNMPGMPDMTGMPNTTSIRVHQTPSAGRSGVKKSGGVTSHGGHMGTSGMMPSMMMSATTNLADPMTKEGSGTSWLPESTPMYGKMIMRGGDTIMLHGAITPRYVNVGSKRGDRQFAAPNWFMGMDSHPLGADAQLGLRAMISLDPITVGGFGYPLLYQTGESWHGQPLHDRQHPHDLFSELSATYSRLVGGGNSAYLYLGYPGEPALGPPTFMHRLIAFDLPDAPISHHWQDATHITFGVATFGLNLGSKFKIEGSDFTGREPDENRYSFDKARFDSYSGRLSFNPDANNAFQVSYGFLKSPEARDPGSDAHLTTASWLYNRPLGMDANFTTSLVWGQRDLTDEGKTNSYLVEADYQHHADTFFGRAEEVQKSGHELVLPDESLGERKFNVGEYTFGYLRDVTHGQGIDAGVGAAITVSPKPSALDPFYGSGTPLSFQIMFRLRPSRMSGMGGMSHMNMGGAGQMPGMNGGDKPQGNAPASGGAQSPMPGMDMDSGQH
jgi:hypothetical protein